jgi:hypothetical protein
VPVGVVHRAPQHLEQVGAVRAGVVRDVPAVELGQWEQGDRVLDQVVEVQRIFRVEFGSFLDGQECPVRQWFPGVRGREDLPPAAQSGRRGQVGRIVRAGVLADRPRLTGRPEQRPANRTVRRGRGAGPGMQAGGSGGVFPQLGEDLGDVQGRGGVV